MRSRSAIGVVAAAWIGALAAGLWIASVQPARAQGASDSDSRAERRVVHATLMVTYLSNREGGIDPRARKLDERLRRQNIRYPSARVLESRNATLEIDRVETIALPDGRVARLQPIHVGDDGVLLAVDVEDAVKMDVRVREGRRVVIDGGRFEDGKLVISIEPTYR
jgi:hypothetical protein